MTVEASTRSSYDIGEHSPCVGICDLDPVSGWCRGCARTGVEVGEWAGASVARKHEIWAHLPERHAALGSTMQLMAWSTAGILDWAADRIDAADGGWLVGQGRTSGVFVPAMVDGLRVMRDHQRVQASGTDAAFRITAHDKLRLFAFGAPDRATLHVLTLPKGRVTIPRHSNVTPVANDERTISVAPLPVTTVDLGLWRDGVRAMVRTDNPGLAMVLPTIAASAGGNLLKDLPNGVTGIVESESARVEWSGAGALVPNAAADQLARCNLPGWAAVVAVHWSDDRAGQ